MNQHRWCYGPDKENDMIVVAQKKMSLVKNDDPMNDEITSLHVSLEQVKFILSFLACQQLNAAVRMGAVQGETLIMVQEYHEMTITRSCSALGSDFTFRLRFCHQNTIKGGNLWQNWYERKTFFDGSESEEGSARSMGTSGITGIIAGTAPKENHS
ncbi:hypothetical protein Tco_0891586 [Tanacetum coccineum]|uniref:Uncharacterized protein n=1 Tax=Tanacetum coccineum TaxID=301880 RepID=A0ABQ5C541_9ASTR